MLRRKIEEKLELWWNSDTALLVDGSRQVGKTFSLEQFARKKTDSYVYLNFIEQPSVIPQLIRSKSAEDFLFNLTVVINQPLIRHKTIIFLDEIQHIYFYMQEHQIPTTDFDLITMMKFLVKEGSYRYLLSGSLMGVQLYDIASWPTGYMTTFQMYPLDFEEFLWANNVQNTVMDHARNCFEQRLEVDPFIHEKLLYLFQQYLLVGGMPKAVSVFIETNDMNMVELAHQNIELYNRRDILKYAPIDKRFFISNIYDLLPEELNKQNKRFTLGLLKSKNNHALVEDSFLWLVNAGIAIPVYSVDSPSIPLRIASNRRLLKLFHEDCGLLTYLYMDSSLKSKILNNDANINFGAIYENVTAQLLTAHGFDCLYYYNRKNMGEIDFMIEHHGKVLPLEIKSGKDYTVHSAATKLLQADNGIDEVYVFNNQSNVRVEQGRVYLPIYLLEFLHRNN